jgi:hypothetical protein
MRRSKQEGKEVSVTVRWPRDEYDAMMRFCEEETKRTGYKIGITDVIRRGVRELMG